MVEQCLATELSDRLRFGQILIRRTEGNRLTLCHAEDEKREDLRLTRDPEAAIEIARFDDLGNYRPLKTAPNLRHGWQLELGDIGELRRALDYFYPARLSVFAAWKQNLLTTTSLRETLDRQSGMYRIAARISDEQIDPVVGDFCRSDAGCLRTILWKRDAAGATPSSKLPPEKYDPRAAPPDTIPLLCQEGCNLLVNECRKVVKVE